VAVADQPEAVPYSLTWGPPPAAVGSTVQSLTCAPGGGSVAVTFPAESWWSGPIPVGTILYGHSSGDLYLYGFVEDCTFQVMIVFVGGYGGAVIYTDVSQPFPLDSRDPFNSSVPSEVGSNRCFTVTLSGDHATDDLTVDQVTGNLGKYTT
jgi:hypothetical protein